VMRSIIANLTPALRRQDHTTSPSAIASFVHAKKHVTTLLRPPHPVPTFVTMANAPCVQKIWQNVRTGGCLEPPVAGTEPVCAQKR
jgi:hypothetical protein